METSLSHNEYVYWLAFFSEEGFPQDREDLRTATLASVIANMSGRKLKRQVKPKEFMPKKWIGPPPPKTIEQQNAEFRAFKEKYLAMKKQTMKKGVTRGN